MYSNIDDCDEGQLGLTYPMFSTYIYSLVYNFWEPLHFLDQGYGFQTWEVSPQYAIRSWAYILLHYVPPRISGILFGVDKVGGSVRRAENMLMYDLEDSFFFRSHSSRNRLSAC